MRRSCRGTRKTATLVIETFILLLLLPVLLATAMFVAEVVAGLRRGRPLCQQPGHRPRAVIVIPAHDEEAVIGGTLVALVQASAGVAEILVVADNCIDATADITRQHGVRVTERQDTARRGKGFALDHARQLLTLDPPEVVVVLDADCTTDRASLVALISAAARINRPAQAINLLRPDRSAPPLVQISTFAFMLKNLVRQRGLQRLARRVHLTGTGMALPWPLFQEAKLATASIVEDIKLGIELAEAGHAPLLAHDARVWSNPADAAGTLVQRRRWEGGFLATMRQAAPKALKRGVRQADLRSLLAGLDLCVPPLALLGALNAGLFLAAALLTWLFTANWWPVGVHAGVLLAAGTAVLLAWWREGRAFLAGRELLKLPFYVLWKVPMYIGLRRDGTPKEWLRTGR